MVVFSSTHEALVTFYSLAALTIRLTISAKNRTEHVLRTRPILPTAHTGAEPCALIRAVGTPTLDIFDSISHQDTESDNQDKDASEHEADEFGN